MSTLPAAALNKRLLPVGAEYENMEGGGQGYVPPSVGDTTGELTTSKQQHDNFESSGGRNGLLLGSDPVLARPLSSSSALDPDDGGERTSDSKEVTIDMYGSGAGVNNGDLSHDALRLFKERVVQLNRNEKSIHALAGHKAAYILSIGLRLLMQGAMLGINGQKAIKAYNGEPRDVELSTMEFVALVGAISTSVPINMASIVIAIQSISKTSTKANFYVLRKSLSILRKVISTSKALPIIKMLTAKADTEEFYYASLWTSGGLLLESFIEGIEICILNGNIQKTITVTRSNIEKIKNDSFKEVCETQMLAGAGKIKTCGLNSSIILNFANSAGLFVLALFAAHPNGPNTPGRQFAIGNFSNTSNPHGFDETMDLTAGAASALFTFILVLSFLIRFCCKPGTHQGAIFGASRGIQEGRTACCMSQLHISILKAFIEGRHDSTNTERQVKLEEVLRAWGNLSLEPEQRQAIMEVLPAIY